MLLLKSIRRHQDRSMVHLAGPTSVHFHCACGFDTQTLAPMVDSLVRVSRRVACCHYASIRANAVLSRRRPHDALGYNTPRGELHSQGLYRAPPTDAGLPPNPKERWQVWQHELPFQQFHMLFNSLSKVLFIFRSLYLCAIGLWPIFSFRRNLPPT